MIKSGNIIQDIHGLNVELTRLESQYGLLSADFYHLYKSGEIEQSRDFITWVGYYEVKLEREERYGELLDDRNAVRNMRFQRVMDGIQAAIHSQFKPSDISDTDLNQLIREARQRAKV